MIRPTVGARRLARPHPRPLRRTSLGIALLVLPSIAVAQRRDTTTTDSLTEVRRLERVTVTAIRGGGEAPIAQKVVSRADLDRANFGQDVPMILQSVPSLTSHSETGSYWGYSYLRLRGIEQSRINLSLDGIPLNDPEDQVLYFANFADLANSLHSVQVQRGVGTSGAGTASFAGSINFETQPLATARQGGELQLGAGSFGTRRTSLEYHSGLTESRFAAYGRLSALQTDGYRRHSDVLGRSAFVSAGYFGDRNLLKLTATAGLLRDTMAYYAASEADLATDRRVNPLEPKAGDQFGEQLVGLSYTRLLGEQASLSTTLYRISASGHYDVYIDPTTLWDFHLDFSWYGVTSAWSWSRAGLRLNAGVNANDYARDHYAIQRADRVELYRNTGHKRDASGFGKASWDVGRLTLFGDLQGRWAEFRYEPDAEAGISERRLDWAFLNPKAGLTWRATPKVRVFGSFGVTSREPTRSDMLAGFDNLDTSNVDFVGPLERVRPERVHDTEVGLGWTGARASIDANLFAMEFRNEIAPIGALSYLGAPLRKNVGRSYRRGVEIDAGWRPTGRLEVGGAVTLMRARIHEYVDDATEVEFRGVEPLLSPKVVVSHHGHLQATRSMRIGLTGRYLGRSYLANTSDARFTLPASYLLDGSVALTRPRWGLSVHANNLADTKRYGSGYTDGETSYYFVVPPRNILFTARLIW